MSRFAVLLLSCLSFASLWAQDIDSLNNLKYELEQIAVTATQTNRKSIELPAQIDVIRGSEIESFPLNNIDDILKTSSNINVNRSWGIFSKNSSVTMRGLEGSDRTLVLVDGVPKNKLGGGSVNWHNINPAAIERIEVIKGPASSLYGNNAMGGVINIITKKPEGKFGGKSDLFLGSYGTKGGALNLSGREENKEKGFYWNLNGFFRKGDGYIFEVPEFIDDTDVPTYLEEFGGGGRVGYQFSESNSLEFSYDYYDELRGSGRKVFLVDGSYEAYQTNQFKTRYSGKIANGDINLFLYYNHEQFFGQKESLNDYFEYRLQDSYSSKGDLGLWATYSREFLKGNTITAGLEGKAGSLFGEDIYRTSPDIIEFGSKMNILGLFVQDELELLEDKIKIIGGLRADYVSFTHGYQRVLFPSSVTGFAESFEKDFTPNSWVALSPKLALQYSLSQRSHIYTSYGIGFMPPGLKDLAQTGKIRKGFRLANPELKPESLSNYEIGYKSLLGDNISISSALYYSIGRDFQYMVGTGDSIDTGGNSLKPVMKPENIAGIGIIGGELSMVYYLNKNTRLKGAYSYNYSKVTDYVDNEGDPGLGLTGKFLAEVSPHLFYAGINTQNKIIQININCSYVSEQWFDDENTIKVDDYFLVNLRLSKDFIKQFKIYLDVQNLLDKEYIDRKGQLSPGRYIVAGMSYVF